MPLPVRLVVKKGHEDTADGFGGNGLAVIANVDNRCLAFVFVTFFNADALGIGLDCIFHEVDKYLSEHIGVGIDNRIFTHSALPGDTGI